MEEQNAESIVMTNFRRQMVEDQPVHVYNLKYFNVNNIGLLSECLQVIAQHQQTLNEEASVALSIRQYILPKPEMSPESCSVLVNSNWSPRIKYLTINFCSIDVIKCKQLSKGKWTNIESIDLQLNCINDEGVFYLSQADWKTVKKVILSHNKHKLQGEACLHLSKAWPNLEQLHLYQNKIGSNGCLHLSEAQWPLLTYLNIGQNNITAKGCLHLSKAQFPSLVSLDLRYNPVSDEGCKYLASGSWPLLQKMDLRSCQLGEKTAKYLSKSCWPKLKQLNLNKNVMGLRGCKYLTRGQWHNLAFLRLDGNGVQSKGCEELAKAVWNKMERVCLHDNSINREDYRYLSSKKWLIYGYKMFEE